MGSSDVFPSCFRASQLVSSARRAGERFGASVGWRFASCCGCCSRGRLVGGGRTLPSTFSENPCLCKYTIFLIENLCYLVHIYKNSRGTNQFRPWIPQIPRMGFSPVSFCFCRRDVSVPIQFMETWSAQPVEPRERLISSQSRHRYLIRWAAPYAHCLGMLLILFFFLNRNQNIQLKYRWQPCSHQKPGELYPTPSLTQSKKINVILSIPLFSTGLE